MWLFHVHVSCPIVLKSHERGNLVQVAEGKWRPLVVEVGALGSVTGVSKIAANVIAPLADRNVSVYCASTNQEDYVLVSTCMLNEITHSTQCYKHCMLVVLLLGKHS